MGYTTKYSGTVTVEPQMDWAMRAAIREFCANADVGKVGKNLNLDGTCDWKASDDFTGLVHNGMEKSYDQDKWLQALIDDLLAPAGFNCNGIIDCQGEDVGDTWRIYVRDNEVSKDTPSYADKVNAPLSEETVTALKEELASGAAAAFKRPRNPHPKFTDDPKLAELRAKLHPEPEPAQPLSSVGDALRDLGNAIAFKATQGVEAVADFVTDVEGALELCAQEGNTKPLDALFKTLRAEHNADAMRADFIAALDDDIPSTSYEIPESEEHDTASRHFLDDDNLETWAEESRQLSEEAMPAYKAALDATGHPSKWDDTALNHWWLIWSNKHSLWWLPNSSGYTENFNNAGRYTFDQAVAIVKKSSNGWNYQQTSLPPTTMVPDPYEN